MKILKDSSLQIGVYNLLILMSFQIHKTFVHLRNPNEDIFIESWWDLCPSTESPFHQNWTLQNVHKEIANVFYMMKKFNVGFYSHIIIDQSTHRAHWIWWMVAQMFLLDVREPMISYIVSHKHVWASTRTNNQFFAKSSAYSWQYLIWSMYVQWSCL